MQTYTKTRPVADISSQTLSFVKENGIWYADLPEFLDQGLGTKSNLMMVDGADTFLDLLSGQNPTITLQISTELFPGWQTRMEKLRKGMNTNLLSLIGHAPVDYGAYYKVTDLQGKPFNHQLWLCPVTEYVFGQYPPKIYASIITHN
jgi:hypothetical protein